MTKYIQITKQDENNPHVWYNRYVGNIYPVRDCPHAPELNYRVAGTDYSIGKSDCEEVALPAIHKTQAANPVDKGVPVEGKLAAEYINGIEMGYAECTAAYQAYKAGFKAAKAELDGAHLITTAQADTLIQAVKILEMRGEQSMAAMLRKDFSAVFAPAKTYKIGQRFKYDWRTLVINQVSGNRVCINTTEGHLFEGPFEVVNVHKITEGEMKDALGPCWGSMELIEPTALEELNAHDSYLPNALKGGRHV